MRHRAPRLVVSLLLALGLLAGCASAEVKPTRSERARDYYPLAVGNRWVFRVKPAPPGQDRQEVRILSKDADGFFVSNVGTRLAARSTGIFDGDRFLLEEPLETGHDWLAVPSVSTVERYRIIGTGVLINVPAGSFSDCVQVEIEQPITARDGRSGRLLGVWTYAPGVGPVHFVQRVELDGVPATTNAEYALVEFDLVAGAEKAAPEG